VQLRYGGFRVGLNISSTLWKMESTDPAERKWACVAVSNIIQNDPSTRRLLQGKNAVGILITRLSDSEEEVVVEAAGALRYGILVHHVWSIAHFLNLRNLCIDGGHELCGEMYNKNVLAPLKTFVPKAREKLTFAESRSDFTSKDSPNTITVFREPKIRARKCTEDRV